MRARRDSRRRPEDAQKGPALAGADSAFGRKQGVALILFKGSKVQGK